MTGVFTCRFLAPGCEYLGSTWPTASCWGVPWESGPTGNSLTVSWTWCCLAGERQNAPGLRLHPTTSSPPEGLAAVLTAAVPPEPTGSARWTGRLRRPGWGASPL